MTVFEKIEAQQKGCENTPAWMVGEQLKDICAADPECATLVAEDLESQDMSIQKAEAAIKTHADKLHKEQKGKCVCIPPNVAEQIIREFYGLPAAPDKRGQESMAEEQEKPDMLDLFSFL